MLKFGRLSLMKSRTIGSCICTWTKTLGVTRPHFRFQRDCFLSWTWRWIYQMEEQQSGEKSVVCAKEVLITSTVNANRIWGLGHVEMIEESSDQTGMSTGGGRVKTKGQTKTDMKRVNRWREKTRSKWMEKDNVCSSKL